MNASKSSFDSENLKKLAPLSIGIGVVLGVLLAIRIPFGGLWGIILTLAWIFCGILYANALVKAGISGEVSALALNGALLAMIAELAYDVLSGILLSIETGSLSSFFSLSLFLQAGIIGALSAVVWHTVQKTNKK